MASMDDLIRRTLAHLNGGASNESGDAPLVPDAQSLRLQAAAAAGLPERHAQRLEGTTLPELTADARRLAVDLVSDGHSLAPRSTFDGGPRAAHHAPKPMAEILDAALRERRIRGY